MKTTHISINPLGEQPCSTFGFFRDASGRLHTPPINLTYLDVAQADITQ